MCQINLPDEVSERIQQKTISNEDGYVLQILHNEVNDRFVAQKDVIEIAKMAYLIGRYSNLENCKPKEPVVLHCLECESFNESEFYIQQCFKCTDFSEFKPSH
jgi:hypothetical protein